MESLKKEKVDIRCSPRKIFQVRKGFTPEQTRIVNSMGLGGVLMAPEIQISHALIEALARKYIISENLMRLHSGDIMIQTTHIGSALGLPSCGEKFPQLNARNAEIVQPFKHLKMEHLEKKLTNNLNEGDDFRRAFILYVMMCFLSPTANKKPTKDQLRAIIDVERPGKYNWSDYIHNHLVEGITQFQKGAIKGINGCVHLLMIFYFHHGLVGKFDPLVHPLPPWITYWGREQIMNRIKEEEDNHLGLIKRRTRTSKNVVSGGAEGGKQDKKGKKAIVESGKRKKRKDADEDKENDEDEEHGSKKKQRKKVKKAVREGTEKKDGGEDDGSGEGGIGNKDAAEQHQDAGGNEQTDGGDGADQGNNDDKVMGTPDVGGKSVCEQFDSDVVITGVINELDHERSVGGEKTESDEPPSFSQAQNSTSAGEASAAMKDGGNGGPSFSLNVSLTQDTLQTPTKTLANIPSFSLNITQLTKQLQAQPATTEVSVEQSSFSLGVEKGETGAQDPAITIMT